MDSALLSAGWTSSFNGRVSLACGLVLAAGLGQPAMGSVVVDFEDLSLSPESYYNGADGAGGFVSRGALLNNTFTDFGGGFTAWSGWSYSNVTDNTTGGYENQYSAIPGSGAGPSANYAVAFAATDGEARIALPESLSPSSIAIANTTYAYLSMLHGDSFAKRFGGTSGDDPDYFLLSIAGLDATDQPVGVVEFYLADFRFADNSLDYLVDQWTEVDLSALQDATTLTFSLASSDVGQYGINTPTYFAVDDLRLIPEPASLILLGLGGLTVLLRRKPQEKRPHRDWRRRTAGMSALLAICSASAFATGGTPFATRVVDFSPAPGQWVNDSNFNNPTAALGRPHAGGFASPDHSSLVSLGGFGGSITLGFEHTIWDEPFNPFGMDAIVFSNAFWAAPAGSPDPNIHWAECATIEISLDENQNRLPDDRWYLIPGSHIADLADQYVVKTWDDALGDDTYPPSLAAWIPPGHSGVWTTEGFELPSELINELGRVVNPSPDPALEGIYGYAEYSPTLVLGDLDADNVVEDPTVTVEDFYTVPDNPLAVGITPGSGGGDAFDIAWAVDPTTGEPANLPGFDFIRLTTAFNIVDGELAIGERSAEIDAVSDVTPDPFGHYDEDGDVDLFDVAGLQLCFGADVALIDECLRFDRHGDGFVELPDFPPFADLLIGPR